MSAYKILIVEDDAPIAELLAYRLRKEGYDTGIAGTGAKALQLAAGVHPDLILLDGGAGHVGVVRALLAELGLDIPTYGMVKDEHHKTRALTDGTHDIGIAREQSVFVFVYGLQEEVHRYSVGRMSHAKRKTLTRSVLENIKGIGAGKAKKYLKAAGSLARLKTATPGEMAEMGIPAKDAAAIAAYFAEKAGKKGN